MLSITVTLYQLAWISFSAWAIGTVPLSFICLMLRWDYIMLKRRTEALENLTREQTQINLKIQERLANQVQNIFSNINDIPISLEKSLDRIYQLNVNSNQLLTQIVSKNNNR